MKKIGILRGMETTFPDGLVAHINETYGDRGVHAEFVQIGGVVDTGDPGYAVILDRISHEVPFYRSYLKWAALKGTYVVNNPFWWSADDKFIDNVIAERAGVAVPRTVILPHKDTPPNTTPTSFRNLQYPLNWDAVFDYVGFPAFLKPYDGGGWRGVTKVRNREELFAAYDASGIDCMMLQEGIEFEDYFRCYGIGQRDVRIMRYNPDAPDAGTRYTHISKTAVSKDMEAKLERDVLALCRALGYDMNTVEFAVRDGVPYAIDFMNPAPDADYWTVGQESYEWVIRTVGAFLVEKALEARPSVQFSANGVLEPARGASLLATAQEAAVGAQQAAGAQIDRAAKAVKKAASPRAASAKKAAKDLAERAEDLAEQIEDRIEDLADQVEDRVEAAVEAVKRAVGVKKAAPKTAASAASGTGGPASGSTSRTRTPKAKP